MLDQLWLYVHMVGSVVALIAFVGYVIKIKRHKR
jgi:hypothetical protein